MNRLRNALNRLAMRPSMKLSPSPPDDCGILAPAMAPVCHRFMRCSRQGRSAVAPARRIAESRRPNRVVPMPDPIEFYFDFSSPYGYLASTRIDALAEKHG